MYNALSTLCLASMCFPVIAFMKDFLSMFSQADTGSHFWMRVCDQPISQGIGRLWPIQDPFPRHWPIPQFCGSSNKVQTMTGSFQEVPTSGDMQNIRLSKRAGLRTLTCHCSDYSSLQERHPSCLRKGCRLFGRTFQCSLKLFSSVFLWSVAKAGNSWLEVSRVSCRGVSLLRNRGILSRFIYPQLPGSRVVIGAAFKVPRTYLVGPFGHSEAYTTWGFDMITSSPWASRKPSSTILVLLWEDSACASISVWEDVWGEVRDHPVLVVGLERPALESFSWTISWTDFFGWWFLHCLK